MYKRKKRSAKWIAAGAVAVLLTTLTPAANAAGINYHYATCNSGASLSTIKGESGGSKASTSRTGDQCTSELGVRASYHRGNPGQTYDTGYKYLAGKSVTYVEWAPGSVIGAGHRYIPLGWTYRITFNT